MRLICGYVRLDGGAAEAKTLVSMTVALTRPGTPCCVRQRIDGPAALAVLDFGEARAAANPPGATANLFRGPDGTWLAADLRLDRPAELAAVLGLPAATSPESLALAAWERWGEDLPDRLDGDFAIAAWQAGPGRLVCARDFMGVRPFCYTHLPGRFFAFASLPRGLHASGVVTAQPNPVAIGRLLVEMHFKREATGFENIQWLPPGHTLTLTTAGLRLHRAWRPEVGQVGSWRGTAGEAAANLRTLLHEAVSCRLPARGPVAAHLSGGLDSSCIAVIAARQMRMRGGKLHAYSQLAKSLPGVVIRDETEYVKAVLEQEPDIEWSPAYATLADNAGATDSDLPIFGPVGQSDDRICEQVAAAGCELLLSGAGGDEGATYNGTGLYVTALRGGHWQHVHQELHARAVRQRRPFRQVAATSLLGPLIPDWLRELRQRLRGRPADYDRRRSLDFLTPSLAASVRQSLDPVSKAGSRPDDRIRMLTAGYLADRGNRLAILGARHGIAFTFPLLDRRIIDFTLSLPVTTFLHNGFSRQPFRDSMTGILPDLIRDRETKFVPFPDLPIHLAGAKPGLLSEIDALRACLPVTALFDLDAIATALRAAPEGEDAVLVSQAFNASGYPARPRTAAFRRAMHGLRALEAARHFARGHAGSREKPAPEFS